MGIQLKKDPSKRGKFIKLFPANPVGVSSNKEPSPALFWDKYSNSAFAAIPQLQEYNSEFESISRYSLISINQTIAPGATIGTYAHRVFPDTNFGLVEEDAVFRTYDGSDTGMIGWLVNAKILGLVSTSHEIKWKAIYKISSAELPDAIGSGTYFSWIDDNKPIYEKLIAEFPSGIDLFNYRPGKFEIDYVDNDDYTQHITIYLANLAVHTCYNRAWVSFPSWISKEHTTDNGYPTIFSGTLHLSATVDGISSGGITLNLVRLLIPMSSGA